MSKRNEKKRAKDLLKKAAEVLEEQPETAPQENTAPALQEGKSKSGLPADRRRALISYMAILFAVAFLLVALSLAVQYRDSQNTISQLGDSAKTALEKVNILQEDNLLLQRKLQEMEEEMELLSQQLEDAQAALILSENEGSILEGASQEILQEKIDAERRASAYQLLAQALDAASRGDEEAFQEAMSGLLDLSGYLDSADLSVYQELLAHTSE